MKMKKFFGNALNGYSLLELLATVTVLVALATVMLPSVTVNKKTIYNTTETYNLSGTQRYLEMFNAMYKGTDGTLGAFNCYPNTFSTGFVASTAIATPADMAADPTPSAGRLSPDTMSLLSNAQDPAATGVAGTLPIVLTPANVDVSGDTTVVTCADIRQTGVELIKTPVAMNIANAISLFKGGITTLNYGSGGNMTFSDASYVGVDSLAALDCSGGQLTTAAYGTNPAYVIKYNATSLNSIPRNCTVPTAKNAVTAGTDFISLLGYTADNWGTICTDINDDIFFLFVTPNMNWSQYHADAKYTDGGTDVLNFTHQIVKDSQVQVPIPATSPWMPVDSYRYYIAVFDVSSGTTASGAITIPDPTTGPASLVVSSIKSISPAKLLGILSPSNLSTATP